MKANYFTTAGASPYHPAQLIIKLAPAGAAPLAAFHDMAGAAAAPASAALATRGLSALARFEKAGLIKKVIPLSRKAEGAAARGSLRALAAIARSVHDTPERNPYAGASIIELEGDAQVEELRTALADDPTIEYAARVPIRYLLARRRPSLSRSHPSRATRRRMTVAASPPAPSTMWNLAKIQWPAARALASFKDAQEIKVAVLDSGIDEGHPDLTERIASYVYRHSDLPIASGPKDYIGHGTHVAGTIGALINNDMGINGICECQLHIWKIFDDTPDFQDWSNNYGYWVDDVMYRRALADCLDEGMNVVNLSIGGPAEPGPRRSDSFRTVTRLRGHGRRSDGQRARSWQSHLLSCCHPGRDRYRSDQHSRPGDKVLESGRAHLTQRARTDHMVDAADVSRPDWFWCRLRCGQAAAHGGAGFSRYRLRRLGWHVNGFASRRGSGRSVARAARRNETRRCA